MNNKCLAILCIIFIIPSLASCTFHLTKDVADELKPEELQAIYKTKPKRMRTLSKCPMPPSVNIINKQATDEDYLMWDRGVTKWYINPKQLTNYIVDYMKNAFEKCNVIVDANSAKTLQVSMYGASFTQGVWAQGADVRLKVEIPDMLYTEIYEANDNSPKSSMRAMAYAIHQITWDIVNDPFIQDYILCRGEYLQTEESKKIQEERIRIAEKTQMKLKSHYVGCYKDKQDTPASFGVSLTGRDINGFTTHSNRLTNELCISMCKEKGFKYAGTQFSTHCFCGNQYGSYGEANNCNMNCSGNIDQICGGSWANSVYQSE